MAAKESLPSSNTAGKSSADASSGDSSSHLTGRDATHLCLAVRARLVDARGRAGAEVVARVAGTLLVAESKHLGRSFDANDIGAWCRRTTESKGRGVGPVRRTVPIKREDGWRVRMRMVRWKKKTSFLGDSEEKSWRVELTGDVPVDGKGGGEKKEKLLLDFGARKGDATAWFETLRGAVTPWWTLFGIAEDDVKNGIEIVEEELSDSSDGKSDAGRTEERAGNDVHDQEGDARDTPGEGKTSANTSAGLEKLKNLGLTSTVTLKNLAKNPRFTKMAANPVAQKTSKFLVKGKVPRPRTTPQIFVAKQVMSHVYKRRFTLKTALMRTPAERAYANLHHVRLAYMNELFEVAGRGGSISKLAEAVDSLEERWRVCDTFVVCGHGLAGIVGRPAAVLADTNKLADELSKACFVVSGKWESTDIGSIDELLRSVRLDGHGAMPSLRQHE